LKELSYTDYPEWSKYLKEGDFDRLKELTNGSFSTRYFEVFCANNKLIQEKLKVSELISYYKNYEADFDYMGSLNSIMSKDPTELFLEKAKKFWKEVYGNRSPLVDKQFTKIKEIGLESVFKNLIYLYKKST